MKRWIIKAILDECLGHRTCGLCEAFIPGLWTKNGGILVLDDYKKARAAFDNCPQGCLRVSAVKGEEK